MTHADTTGPVPPASTKALTNAAKRRRNRVRGPNRAFTDAEIRIIRARLDRGDSALSIAKEAKVNPRTIYDIKHRRTYIDVR